MVDSGLRTDEKRRVIALIHIITTTVSSVDPKYKYPVQKKKKNRKIFREFQKTKTERFRFLMNIRDFAEFPSPTYYRT